MRIIDMNGNEISNPDLSKGKLVQEKLFVKHHEAVEAIEEQWHYETVAEYPNGGKDVQKVVDIAGVAAQEAWDEYETVQRFIPYTEEELDQMESASNQPTLEEQVAELREALELLLSGATE